ncbi:protein kinase [Kitasatospora sp. NPDC059408]|uniref:protein kinase domain-containing protein n=1 Tax=Kitasatospora sp. NPDC059408 TaxID=3346823 RepID=UPI0036CB055F
MQAGTVLDGRYELVQRIGAGGFGQVWEAYDPKIGRPVAVKLLLEDDAAHSARFTREATVAGSLSHPHIVTVHDVGTTEHDGRPLSYLVMELIDGTPLSTVQERGPLPMPDLLYIAWCVADALTAAHREGLIHRDIKPSNIMIIRDEHNGTKLVDFGIAKSADTRHDITATGILIGTPAYMAPEAFNGALDHRSDLYSLGCVIHEMAAGQRPFDGTGGFWRYAHQHANDTPPRLRTLRPEVPLELEDLIVRLLAKSPDHRPATAQETARELRAITDRYYNPSAPQKGKDSTCDVTLTAAEAALGEIIPIRRSEHTPCPDCRGSKRRTAWCSTCSDTGTVVTRRYEHNVRIPAGVREGQRLRLRGLGGSGYNGGQPGDLYVTVHIEP